MSYSLAVGLHQDKFSLHLQHKFVQSESRFG